MSGTEDRKHPSLPQYASPDEQKRRLEALADAHKDYEWTTELDTLPGVPLAASVPRADNPSVPWLLAAAKAAIPIVENTIVDKVGSDITDPKVRAELDGIRAGIAEIEDKHFSAASPGEAIEEGIKGLFDAAVGAVGHLLGRHEDDLLEHIEHLKALAQEHRSTGGAVERLEAYAELFTVLPLPDVAANFMEDATFARMRVAGPNSMLIEAAKELPENVALTDEQFASVMGEGATLEAAGTSGRLFILDYKELRSLVSGTYNGEQQYLWCPIAVFALRPGEGSLVPVSIQLGQDPTDPVVVAPKTRDWAWEMAKFAVQVADGNYHELFAHLGRTHLVEEAFAMATRRSLAPSHPLHILLVPHFQGTLFINNLAAGSLIAAGGPIDQIFAGQIDTVQLAAAADRLSFDFRCSYVPTQVKRRGVGPDSKLTDYPYRDDALSVWEAIGEWTLAYVRTYYTSDDDIVGDTELAAWCAEVKGIGNVEGFEAPDTREQLAGILTMVIFTGSAQHAAVNFPQRTLMTYAPNMTGAAWSPVTQDPSTEFTWVGMMPPIELAELQLQTLALLGGVYFSQLGDYKAAGFPYGAWFLDDAITRSGGALETFQKNLREVEAEIEKRNSERAVAYPYLLPSQIPQSINI